MSGTKGLNRQQMADLIARQFQDGWVVNLGVGIPTMCSNTDIGDRDITYHSENGVIGYGPIAPAGEEFVRRFSLCCGREGCRKRATPPSLRFLGRRVYLCAVVLVASMFAQVLGTDGSVGRVTGEQLQALALPYQQLLAGAFAAFVSETPDAVERFLRLRREWAGTHLAGKPSCYSSPGQGPVSS